MFVVDREKQDIRCLGMNTISISGDEELTTTGNRFLEINAKISSF